MLRLHAGDSIAGLVASSPVDLHPLLVCLVFQNGRIEVASTIEGNMPIDLTLKLLINARDVFDSRNEEPDPTNLQLTIVSGEGWTMSESLLIPIMRDTEEFRRIANEFMQNTERIVSIDRVENPMWLAQFLNNKESIDARLDGIESERLFAFTCSPSTARQILKKGFNDRLKSIYGKIFKSIENSLHLFILGRQYGYGFYFPSFSSFYSTQNGEQTMLVCRVLVGRSCLGHWTMETCPSGYDSTTNESGTYVVYSNRHILPKYLITFR
ncbi:unnamed protein product [Rotaria sp. Silwood1]|nr:unnamed protein product [Rotaria sp. Silwood1]